MSSTKNIPFGLTLASIYYVLLGIIGYTVGLITLYNYYYYDITPSFTGDMFMKGVMIASIFFITGIIHFITAYGLISIKKWSYIMAIIVSVITLICGILTTLLVFIGYGMAHDSTFASGNATFDMYVVLIGSTVFVGFSVVFIPILILWYLCRPQVKKILS